MNETCGEICGDNRFEIINAAKKDLLESTNINTSTDEMKVLDNFLFRCWQMGWLEKYEKLERKREMTDKTKAVFTFKVIDKHGEKTVCNIIEPLNVTLERVCARIDDLHSKSFELAGNIVLQFVKEDIE